MRTPVILLAIAIITTSCTDRPNVQQDYAQQENLREGPAPDAEIVDLPMDSLNDDEMAEDTGESLEGQVVESNR